MEKGLLHRALGSLEAGLGETTLRSEPDPVRFQQVEETFISVKAFGSEQVLIELRRLDLSRHQPLRHHRRRTGCCLRLRYGCSAGRFRCWRSMDGGVDADELPANVDDGPAQGGVRGELAGFGGADRAHPGDLPRRVAGTGEGLEAQHHQRLPVLGGVGPATDQVAEQVKPALGEGAGFFRLGRTELGVDRGHQGGDLPRTAVRLERPDPSLVQPPPTPPSLAWPSHTAPRLAVP